MEEFIYILADEKYMSALNFNLSYWKVTLK